MSSEPIRDPFEDPLLTPQNCAFIIIDYQPVQVNSIASMERQRLVTNIVRASKAAVVYGLPIVHSTVNVKTGINKPPIAPLRQVLDNVPTYDRTTINAWEDVEFRKAVQDTGRRKLIMTVMDRGLPDVPGAGCAARGLRGVRRCGRGWRHFRNGA